MKTSGQESIPCGIFFPKQGIFENQENFATLEDFYFRGLVNIPLYRKRKSLIAFISTKSIGAGDNRQNR